MEKYYIWNHSLFGPCPSSIFKIKIKNTVFWEQSSPYPQAKQEDLLSRAFQKKIMLLSNKPILLLKNCISVYICIEQYAKKTH
jgi:hypothetical protein